MGRYPLTLLFILALCTCGRAQTSNQDSLARVKILDSLRHHSVNAPTAEQRYSHYSSIITYFGYGDSSLTMKRIDTLTTMIPADDAGSFMGRMLIRRANVQRYHGDSEGAKTTLQQAIVSLSAAKDSSLIATTLYNQARLYLPARQYDTTLMLAQQAYDLFKAQGDSRGQLNSLNAMGMVQRRLGNYAQALEYFERALPLAKLHSNRSNQISVLTNLAIASQGLDDFDQAEAYYLQGMELAFQPPAIQRQVAYLRVNLSGMYSLQNKHDAALAELELAVPWFERHGSQREKATTIQGLATAYQKIGNAKQALPYARRSLELVGEQEQLREQNHDVLALIFRDLGQADSSYQHMLRANNLREKTAEEQQDATVAELEARFQSREQQLEIDRLEAEEIASARRIRNRGYIIGATLLALVLLGWLLLRNQRQRQRIEEQNGVISKALNEKELLIKEIHHRVKNNLQMVSSLLNMQTHYIEDEAAADALQLGRSRVRSMALIHQKLYVGDEVSTLVDAKDYLERLIREIVDTHAPPTTKVQLQLDIEPLEMDIDTVVPLGLLTNEAVTNAVKYAFVGRDKGNLQVRLWRREDRHTISIVDDGPGMKAHTANRESFGQLLMTTLAEQLEGELEVKDEGKGVEVVVRF